MSDEQHPIISLPRFATSDLNSLRQIVFRFRSRDQGWSWDRQNHGTYGGSWTWFEAVVREQHHVEGASTETPRVRPDTIRYVRRKWELQRNRHAGTEFEDYKVVFDDGDARMTELKETMKEGDWLELRACATFPSWENRVEEAHVEVWCLDDLRNQKSQLL